MGVPGLQSWLKRRYPEAFVPLPQGVAFDHVYIDLASTLHQVIRRARTKQYFHVLLHSRLDDILAAAQPRQRVVLALDGPAPLAKLLEQRRRRRRESERAQRSAAAEAEATEATAVSASSASGAADGPSAAAALGSLPTVEALGVGRYRPPNPELSTLALTTGSLLMLEVHASLEAYICKKLQDPATAHLSFELSDSTVKGEGELKILSRLLHSSAASPTNTSERGSSRGGGGEGAQQGKQQLGQQGEETHLVLGSDSDLLLMALVAGQRGVYILGDMLEPSSGSSSSSRHKRRRQRGSSSQRLPGASSRGAAPGGPALPLASIVGSASSPAISSSSESSGSESDAEGGSAEVAAVLAGSEDESDADEAAPVAFSRDAAERLWREQHLVGEGSSSSGSSGSQQEVTALAMDLLLLATMCSGNDYLPAVQGMQLSNKHRPGLWDLFTRLRQEPRWRGQSLVLHSCECGEPGSSSSSSNGRRTRGASSDCPTVSINAEMLGALLGDYYRQRVVHFEQPPGEGEVTMVGPGSGSNGSTGAAGSALGSMGGSVLGSMDDGGSSSSGSSKGGDGLVWGEEALAAAARMAAASGSDDETVEGAVRRGSNGVKRKGNITLRGMEAHPQSYIQGLEWVLHMYCSGAVQDYRFMYDLAAPSLLQLLETLQQQAEQQQQQQQQGGQAGVQVQQHVEGQQEEGAVLPVAPRSQRSLQPLLPAACAMALLPRGGRMHAATALRHLMDDGSALEEIYATCDQCLQMGQQMGSMGREVEAARAELAATQLRFNVAIADAAAGQAGAAEAVVSLQAETERQEAELARLRLLMTHLSRSQQEHLFEAHPYKPFPTDELEAAVAAVPLSSYPRRERKLAQFGREFVFSQSAATAVAGPPPGMSRRMRRSSRQGKAAAAGGGGRGSSLSSMDGGGSEDEAEMEQQLLVAVAAAAGEGPSPDSAVAPTPSLRKPLPPPRTWTPMQSWVEECLTFAAAYPRVADPFVIKRSSWRVQRQVLPLHPYMQPRHVQRRADGTTSRPLALLARCHLLDWQQQQQLQTQRQQGQQQRGGRRGLGSRQLVQQRAQPHTWSSAGGGRGVVVRAQLPAAAGMRAALLQGCTRLLGNLRMLRAF